MEWKAQKNQFPFSNIDHQNRFSGVGHISHLAQLQENTVLQYGSIAHSHLNQCGRNLLLGARTDHPELAARDAAPAAGDPMRIDVVGVAARHPAVVDAFTRGLKWEVLSYKMVLEDEQAVSIIQSACNIKGGLQMQEHEMQAISRLSRYCAAEMRVAGQVNSEKVRADLMVMMPDFVESCDFKALLSFVLDLGAERSGFLDDLRGFLSQLSLIHI